MSTNEHSRAPTAFRAGDRIDLLQRDCELTFLGNRPLASPQRTPSGVDAPGVDEEWDYRGPEGLRLTLAARRYNNGERAYMAKERHASPERFTTLVDRVRLSIEPHGNDRQCALRTALLKDGGMHATLFDRSWEFLSRCAGRDVQAWLTELGATRVGTKTTVLGTNDRSNNRLWMTFPEHAEASVCWAAYLATRVYPVLRDERE